MAAEGGEGAFTGGGYTKRGLRRVCFQMRFKPDNLPQYLKDHEAVWPEMQQALRDTGWHNYSLFCRDDGFAVGFFESDATFAEACACMDKTDVNQRWQAAMSHYTAANTSPIDQASELTHYFYLGDDRAAAPPADPQPAEPWAPQAYTGGGRRTKAGRRRFAFSMRFNPDTLDEYLREHEHVWPEMQKAIREGGVHNYSLFYRKDGFAVGYFESSADTFEEALAGVNKTEVSKRWQDAMKKYTVDSTLPTEQASELMHYFYLGTDQQDA